MVLKWKPLWVKVTKFTVIFKADNTSETGWGEVSSEGGKKSVPKWLGKKRKVTLSSLKLGLAEAMITTGGESGWIHVFDKNVQFWADQTWGFQLQMFLENLLFYRIGYTVL